MQFIKDIINPVKVEYVDQISNHIETFIKKPELQRINGDLSVYIIGEINGFFNGLLLAEIIRIPIIVYIERRTIIFKDSVNYTILYSHSI